MKEQTYNEFIQSILDSRGAQGVSANTYKERHHIIPHCLGGTDDKDNLIDLLASEHFIAHKLLALENPDNYKLVFAFSMLVNCTGAALNKRDYEVTAEDYELSRKLFSEVASKHFQGENNPMFDVHRYGKDNPNYGKKHPGLSAGCKNGMYGKHYSKTEEQRVLHSLKAKQYWNSIDEDTYKQRCYKVSGKNNGMYGKTSPRAVSVECLELGVVFHSLTEAEQITRIDRHQIKKCCETNKADKNNNHWKIVEDLINEK